LSFKEEFTDKISLAGLLLSIVVLVMLLWVGSSDILQLDSFTRFSSDFADERIGQITSEYLWNNRTLDVIIQAVLVFGAAAGCIAMLRSGKEKE
jgi:multisubunit Na+/H+ antiporter MnhB subunit